MFVGKKEDPLRYPDPPANKKASKADVSPNKGHARGRSPVSRALVAQKRGAAAREYTWSNRAGRNIFAEVIFKVRSFYIALKA